MAISKVVYKSSASATPVTWIDATPATAAAADIISPKTAMLADGVVTQGSGSGGITPTGNINITQAGQTDVTNYATATVPSGSLVSTLFTTVTPTISVDDDGMVTAGGEDYASESIVYQTGWIEDSSTLVVYKTAFAQQQLPTQAATTITPSTTAQTAVAKGKWTTGAVTVAAMPSGTAGTPTATKGTVSNHSVSVTPSVTNTTGYITGSTKTGTAVSVSASELVSGTYTVDSSGIKDVTNYASASVPAGTAGTPSATKGAVSNHSVSVTPSVTNTTGWITGSTKTGTAVTVTASELVSGSETKSSNGTYDVTNLASLVVAVPIVTYYTGSSTPSAALGSNGDIYLQTGS